MVQRFSARRDEGTVRKIGCVAVGMAVWLLSGLSAMAEPPAEQPEPAIAAEVAAETVVSIAPARSLLEAMQYVTAAADRPDLGRLAALGAAPYLHGIDRRRPSGLVALRRGEEKWMLLFVPVTDPEPLLGHLAEHVGPVDKLAENRWTVTVQQLPLQLRLREGWMFLALAPQHLDDPDDYPLPGDPAQLLGDLPQRYDFAVRVLDSQLAQFLPGTTALPWDVPLTEPIERKEDESDEAFAERVAARQKQIEAAQRQQAEAGISTLGMKIDRATRRALLEFEFSARYWPADLSPAPSQLSGLHLPEQAASLHGTLRLAPETAQQRAEALLELGEKGEYTLNLDGIPPEALESGRKIVELLRDTLIETIGTGQVDAGLLLTIDESDRPTLLLGLHVVDAKRITDSIRELLSVIQLLEPKAPGIRWNVAQHQGFALHLGEIPIPEGKPKERLVPNGLGYALGIDEENCYFAIGHDAETELRAAIDRSLTGQGEDAPILHLSCSVGKLARLVSHIADRPELLEPLGDLETTPDQVRLRFLKEESGGRLVVTLDELMIRLIAVPLLPNLP